jgi:hypothetical protein
MTFEGQYVGSAAQPGSGAPIDMKAPQQGFWVPGSTSENGGGAPVDMKAPVQGWAGSSAEAGQGSGVDGRQVM